LGGEEGVDEALGFVEAVGNGVFPAHFPFFFIYISKARDGVFRSDDSIN